MSALPTRLLTAFLSLPLIAACGGEAGQGPSTAPGTDTGGVVDPSVTTLAVDVPLSGRVFASLAENTTSSDSAAPWDLAFEGYGLFTNGGASGAGEGWAFGPFDASTFDDASVPVAPITTPDQAAGAFLDWYFYEGAPAHVLWSRYHTIGVRDGDRMWKVQILSYYGERDGAPVSGLYRLRYAELLESGEADAGEVDVDGLDATAGGVSGDADAPSECLDLASGERRSIRPSVAASDAGWHLCFRRQTITVNGGVSGPRGVVAADLQETDTVHETLAEVQARSAESTLSAFRAATRGSFSATTLAPDRVVSGFGSSWVTPHAAPPTPAPATWIVRGADGQHTFLLRFVSFTGASDQSPGHVLLQTKVFTP